MTDDDMCPNCVTPWKCNGPHLETLPLSKREERRFERSAARSYGHLIGLNCNTLYDVRCARCLWWSLIGKHGRERRRRIERLRGLRASLTPIRREGWRP